MTVLKPNTNAQRMSLLSHLLRSAWGTLGQDRWSFPRSLGRAASGGALSPAPSRATGVGPEFLHVFLSLFHVFRGSRVFSCLFSRFFGDRTSPLPEI